VGEAGEMERENVGENVGEEGERKWERVSETWGKGTGKR
jgi:hypothetical protein